MVEKKESGLEIVGGLMFLLLVIGSFGELVKAVPKLEFLLFERSIYISVVGLVLLLVYVLYPIASNQ